MSINLYQTIGKELAVTWEMFFKLKEIFANIHTPDIFCHNKLKVPIS